MLQARPPSPPRVSRAITLPSLPPGTSDSAWVRAQEAAGRRKPATKAKGQVVVVAPAKANAHRPQVKRCAAPTKAKAALPVKRAKKAAASKRGAQGTKAACLHARDHAVREGLEFVAHLNAARLRSADLTEATRARFERRAPRFAKL